MVAAKSGIFIKPKSSLAKLKPVLATWVDTVEAYSALTGDASWWYNERANVSILSAAAWQTKGWVAIEEYSTRKRGEDGESKYGRCDLWVTSKRSSFAIEAKHAWQPIGDRTNDSLGYANESIKDAWQDAGKLKPQEADIRVAANFVVPNLSAGQVKKGPEHLDGIIQAWLKELKDGLPWDALAYVFSGDHVSDRKRLFPGVVLLLRERQRGG